MTRFMACMIKLREKHSTYEMELQWSTRLFEDLFCVFCFFPRRHSNLLCEKVIDFWIAEDLVLYILQLFPRQHNPLLKWRAI